MILAINKKIKKAKNEKGFTLVELLVVIAILGVLAAVIIPKVSGNLNTARTNTDDTNQKLLQNAVDRYIATTGTTPATLDVLVPGYIDEKPTKTNGTNFGYSDGTVSQ